ncbi:pyridoxal 5'-phosphate synthase subunit PdxT [Leucobacter sp. Psy1]|uniref:pyridoxal 5'-phosphate synthase glutaminase subunit PdxT n=1 Tax=Leucobacter sp. Psy1 TaxID=2875729 RepID=UPI001CD3749C|nr:pyridoxal 5'-phosphate synthase glutaminase subunit PdxT [Leucobacter sp. Psy1]UBH05752.1 pyridoxal 5'-phosphate synthase subunit PdxT [Leucobacter sp. Psy1]
MRLAGAPTVGVLALQGGVSEHASVLEGLGARVVLVRRPEHAAGPDGPRVDALVLPGGESGVIDRLSRRLGIADSLRDLILAGIPTLGTCAGLILLAERVADPAPGQQSLRVLDVTVRRNAFGAQVASREAEFVLAPGTADAGSQTGTEPGTTVRGALIRAPEITAVGGAARPIAYVDGRVVGAASTTLPVTGVAFHPEVSRDPVLHRMLLDQIDGSAAVTARIAPRVHRTADA